MSGCNENAVTIKNVKLAKLLEQKRQKRKLVKDKSRDDLIKTIREEIESKILQLSRKDVEFYHETSMKMLFEKMEKVQKTEMQMYEQLKGLVDEARRQCITEKENVEANYSVSLDKLGDLAIHSNGRKRKLNVSNC